MASTEADPKRYGPLAQVPELIVDHELRRPPTARLIREIAMDASRLKARLTRLTGVMSSRHRATARPSTWPGRARAKDTVFPCHVRCTHSRGGGDHLQPGTWSSCPFCCGSLAEQTHPDHQVTVVVDGGDPGGSPISSATGPRSRSSPRRSLEVSRGRPPSASPPAAGRYIAMVNDVRRARAAMAGAAGGGARAGSGPRLRHRQDPPL